MPVLTTVLPERAYRWNFTVMGLDYSLFVLALSFTSVYGVLPLFVHHLTTSNLALGFIAAVRAIGSSLPPIMVAAYTERLRRKKPFLLVMTTIERLPYLVLALLIPLLATSHPILLLWLFFALIGLGTWFGGMGLPAWLDLISRMLPADWRGRFSALPRPSAARSASRALPWPRCCWRTLPGLPTLPSALAAPQGAWSFPFSSLPVVASRRQLSPRRAGTITRRAIGAGCLISSAPIATSPAIW